jgi:hypothetical protein
MPLPAPPSASGKVVAPVKGPVEYVRADLVGKHADGGDFGAPPKGSVRRMSCSIGAPVGK